MDREHILLFLFRVFFYGNIGLLIEIWFTGLHAAVFQKAWHMPAKSFLWMALVYGLGEEGLLHLRLLCHSSWVFVVVGLVMVYLAEAVSGVVSKRVFGKVLWDYGQARFGIAGLIRLDYAPFWGLMLVCYDFLSDGVQRSLEFALSRIA